MKPLDDDQKVEVHAFVCTNSRDNGKVACSDVGGAEFHQKLKHKLKEAGIYSTHKATKSGCLGYCNNTGCTIAIYRAEGPAKWFTEVKDEDFDTIWNEITEK